MGSATDLTWLTIHEAIPLLRSGQLDARTWIQYCLDRIAQHDQWLEAWVHVERDAAKRAAELVSCGAEERKLPLAGVPLGIKDIFDIADLPTLAGSSIRAGHVARRDATVIARLRGAGAVFLGKTVTTEFACFDPAATRNPWNPSHTPGGSSSGSAAAVAFGMCPAALGSQTGGSVIRPASYCGVVGFKPSFDRVSRHGVVPVSHHLDHVGWFTRSVADARILFDCLERNRCDNGYARPSTDGRPHVDLREIKMGLLGGFFEWDAAPEVREAVNRAARKLGSAGVEIVPIPLPVAFQDVHLLHRIIMAVEAAQYHLPFFTKHRALYGPNLRALLDEGLETHAVTYADALSHRRRFRRALDGLFDNVDVLLTPSTPTPAPASLATTGDPRFNSPFSHAGVPAVGLPIDLSPDGLPIGLQFVGRSKADEQLLDIAARCEEVLDFTAHPRMPDT